MKVLVDVSVCIDVFTKRAKLDDEDMSTMFSRHFGRGRAAQAAANGNDVVHLIRHKEL